MSEPNITTPEIAECLRVLQEAKGPIVAAGLARRLRLGGVRETQRRHVRAIIEQLPGVRFPQHKGSCRPP